MNKIFDRLLPAFLLLAPVVSAKAGTARDLQEDFVRVAQNAKPAVVNIAAIQEQQFRVVTPNFFFGDPENPFELYEGAPQSRIYRHRTEGVGSGFVIDDKGHVLTNDHVVRDATEIRITFSSAGGKDVTLPGRVVGRDPNLDLAVIQIQSKRNFPFLRLADSDKVRVGEWAVAIGSPFALQQTVTVGIISAVRQSLNIEGRPYLGMLQTDAAINQGNSGGPLLNLDGEVVGVNTAIYSPSGASAGIGFAIPVNEVKLALEYLLNGRHRASGWLGVEVAPIDEVLQEKFGLPNPGGVLVDAVVAGSPAASGGLQRGDVLRTLDGADLQSPQDLVARISRLAPGKAVDLQIYRRGAARTVRVVLGRRPDSPEPARASQAKAPPSSLDAARERTLTWEGAHFEAAQGGGVRVVRLDPSSPLNGTLLAGDTVRGIDGAETGGLKQLQDVLDKVRLSEGAVFDISRRGRAMYVSVKTD